ncbi:hypothetical protein TIFTF001_007781 [Ficus carica]|uniref:BED-type domain-containing protein n=1 Tax=Ficus carica TaxID=3494 RepID=A0AA87ZRU9_FICCA|nr:hypothetical protein TIFTF001_007781 [Ficus carica]
MDLLLQFCLSLFIFISDYASPSSSSSTILREKVAHVDIELDEDVIELEGSDLNKPLNKKRLKSKVWDFFDFLPFGPNKKLKSACKKCGQQYLASNKYGTSNMLKHVKT